MCAPISRVRKKDFVTADCGLQTRLTEVRHTAFHFVHQAPRPNSEEEKGRKREREKLKSQGRLMCCVSGSALEECAFVARRRRSQKVNELCLPNRVRGEGGEKETGERRVGSLLTVNDGCRIESCRPNETGRSHRSVCWCAPRLSHPRKDLKNPQRQTVVWQRTGLYLHYLATLFLRKKGRNPHSACRTVSPSLGPRTGPAALLRLAPKLQIPVRREDQAQERGGEKKQDFHKPLDLLGRGCAEFMVGK